MSNSVSAYVEHSRSVSYEVLSEFRCWLGSSTSSLGFGTVCAGTGHTGRTGENCRVITSEVTAVEENITLQTLMNELVFTHPSSVLTTKVISLFLKYSNLHSIFHSFCCVYAKRLASDEHGPASPREC